MKIKTRLLLNTTIFVITSFVIVWFVVISTRMVNVRIDASSNSLEVVRGVFELNILTNEYLLNSGERPVYEWNKKHEKVQERLINLNLSSQDQKEISNELIVGLAKLDASFNKLVNLRKEEQNNPELTRNEERLVSELLTSSQTVVQEAFRISQLAEQERASIRRISDTALVVFVIIVGVASTAAGFILTRSILRPLISLQKGANKIASGDLDYRVKVEGKDEMAYLAKSFNGMASRLKEIYEGLDKKVRERTKELAEKVREAERAEAKDEALLENIGEGIVGVSDGGDIIFVNREAERLLGYTEEELTGEIFIHSVGLADEEEKEIDVQKRPLHRALLTGKYVNTRDNRVVKKDGSTFSADITATPVLLHGQVIGGVVVFKDITKEKDIDRMKTEFISLASHQLRTPLSAMKWFSEILLSGDVGQLEGEQKEMVENIYQSTERMVELVNALLNISRIESGRIIVDPMPTDLKELVEGVVKEVKPKLDEKKLNFAVSVHEDLPKINIDPKLIRNVYQNLLTNAIKYTPEGGNIEVLISRKNDEVISQVSDNGYGIPKDEQDRVFDRFFRAENILKLETEGTGLGLYLAKAIVESSGGKMWFESKEGEGTTFWFSLPLEGSKPKKGEVTISG